MGHYQKVGYMTTLFCDTLKMDNPAVNYTELASNVAEDFNPPNLCRREKPWVILFFDYAQGDRD